MAVSSQVRGLCGLYDQNMLNDFTTDSEIMEAYSRDFADNFLSKFVPCDSSELMLIQAPCDRDVNVCHL